MIALYFILQGVKNEGASSAAKSLRYIALIIVTLAALFFLFTARFPVALLIFVILSPFYFGRDGIITKLLKPYLKINEPQNIKTDTPMDKAKAYAILGLDDDATKDDIEEAYKRLIAKNHPDKGGSSYIAAQLNAARDLLI